MAHAIPVVSARSCSSPFACSRQNQVSDHAARAGVHSTEVARRLGHSVAMLLKRYAKCIDGQQALANERIVKAFGDGQV